MFKGPLIQPRTLLFKRFASESKSTVVITPSKNYIKRQTEYKQLPDDSQYIEKFYKELKSFQDEIKNNEKIPFINFTDFEKDPNALIHYLEQFIQTNIYNKYSIDDPNEVYVIKQYKEFLNNVKITLTLNGGHPHIFDILIQNKRIFDTFDILKHQMKKKKKDNE
ncbi:hypothetical protein WICMUC_003288 [Wickerhamomyces mucosus]|uniref:Protein FMP23, mitochondrial n=1 Tax=Wickerhamomyces mucosus TaxID=1378264 RepID=A0A9P8TDM5_9ASCO|nr:hypothetical protein WICMUC_003288 [Wickerhamomyces mucosus]